jgi:hypothetical protein
MQLALFYESHIGISGPYGNFTGSQSPSQMNRSTGGGCNEYCDNKTCCFHRKRKKGEKAGRKTTVESQNSLKDCLTFPRYASLVSLVIVGSFIFASGSFCPADMGVR